MIDRTCVYQCCKCCRIFQLPAPGGTDCVHCGHPYVTWLNYGEQFIEKPKPDPQIQAFKKLTNRINNEQKRLYDFVEEYPGAGVFHPISKKDI